MNTEEPTPIKMPDGVTIRISTCEGEDFVNCRTSLTAKHPDGKGVRWTIPNRLLERQDFCNIIVDELLAELDERVERG